MQRIEESYKAFICQHDLERIWSNNEDFRKTLLPAVWTDDEIVVLRRDFIKILSTLILISAFNTIKNFRSIFFNTITHNQPLNDHNLPFTRENLRSFLDIRHTHLFYEKQFVLIPVLLEESEEKPKLDFSSDYRLPFVYERPTIGFGGYGTVDEVGIAPGYLVDKGRPNWPNVRSSLSRHAEKY